MLMGHKTIQNLPESERPYEKAVRYGVSVLSDAELLAVILRTGTRNKTGIELAYDVLEISERYPGLLGLGHARLNDLTKLNGIGTVKALELLCTVELGKRMSMLKREPGRVFDDPKDIAGYFMEELRTLETEHFYVVLFDASGRLIRYEPVFKGTINMSLVSPREALRLALDHDACNLIIMHNHPSGDPTPSNSDHEVTVKFYRACSQVGIPLLDHIVIGDNTYFSYRENRLVFGTDDDDTYTPYGKET